MLESTNYETDDSGHGVHNILTIIVPYHLLFHFSFQVIILVC